MRLLTKFVIVSIAGLTVVIAALAGIGIGVIDNVFYQNHVLVLRVELDVPRRNLTDGQSTLEISDRVIAGMLGGLRQGQGNSYFAYRLNGIRVYPQTSDAPQFAESTVKKMIGARTGEGWLTAGAIQYLTRFVVLSDQGLLIGVRVPETVVYAGRASYLSAIAVAALIILLIGSGGAYLAGRSLSRKVGHTLDALDQISAGEFNVRIPNTDGSDELSTIQRRINNLANSFANRATERDAATRWLEESESRFRDFAESASDAFWETDDELRYTYFSNPGRDFGPLHDFPDIIGQKRGGYFEEHGFNKRVWAGGWKDHLDDLANRKVVRNFEFSGKQADGTVYTRVSTAIPSLRR